MLDFSANNEPFTVAHDGCTKRLGTPEVEAGSTQWGHGAPEAEELERGTLRGGGSSCFEARNDSQEHGFRGGSSFFFVITRRIEINAFTTHTDEHTNNNAFKMHGLSFHAEIQRERSAE